VDLPAPFSPINAWTSPGRSCRETSSFATTPGKRFVMPSSTTKGGALPRPAPSPSLMVSVVADAGYGFSGTLIAPLMMSCRNFSN
jgi:hypothetical protein